MSIVTALQDWREVVAAAEPDPPLRAVLLALLAYTGPDGASRPSVARLAQVTGWGTTTVRERLRVAEDAGLVEVDSLEGGRGNTPVRRPGKATALGRCLSEGQRQRREALKATDGPPKGNGPGALPKGKEKGEEKRAREDGGPLAADGGGPLAGELAGPIRNPRIAELVERVRRATDPEPEDGGP